MTFLPHRPSAASHAGGGGGAVSSFPTPSWLKIPPWLDDIAPGAADVARVIATDPNLSGAHRERLKRLVRDTESAWKKLPVWHTDKSQLSAGEGAFVVAPLSAAGGGTAGPRGRAAAV